MNKSEFKIEHKSTINIKKKILVIGLTSVRLGAMENTNIGNYLIIEPFFRKLKEYIPTSEIRTTIQLSEKFLKEHDLIGLGDKRFWTYRLRTLIISCKDIFLLFLYMSIKKMLNKEVKFLLSLSKLMINIEWADIIIDFSGDLYGDNAPINRFMEGSIKLLISYWLDKPTVMVASSPGPFEKNILYKMLGKYVLNRVKIIANREPRSSNYLLSIGISKEKIINTACPSILFNKKSNQSLEEIYKREGISIDKQKIGLIISGWNMPTPPFDKIPRPYSELNKFIPIIDFFLKKNAQVILLSHSNRIDSKGHIIEGPDAKLCDQLIEISGNSNNGNIIRIKRIYDPETVRLIIGSFDFLISGRLHAALSGLSQMVPTVIIDYGFEPKGYKLLGIAELFGVREYFCDPNNSELMYEKIYKAWNNRNEILNLISNESDRVIKLAEMNFDIIKDQLVFTTNGK